MRSRRLFSTSSTAKTRPRTARGPSSGSTSSRSVCMQPSIRRSIGINTSHPREPAAHEREQGQQERQLVVEDRHAQVGVRPSQKARMPVSMIAIILTTASTR
jgi:hypothetical protein